MKSSCISHPPKTPLVMIREEYLAICDGDHCQAAILNQFEYWTNIKLGYKEQAEVEGEIARAGGMEVPLSDLWIYKSQTELHEELMGLFGIRAVGTALQSLVDKGFLERRNNPKYAWDRTYQYRLQTTKVQDAILQKCKFEKSKAQSQRQQKGNIESDQTGTAVPETTTEITSKETEEKKEAVSDFPEKTPVPPAPPAPSPGGGDVALADDAAIVEEIIEQTMTHPGPCDLGLVSEQAQAKEGNWADAGEDGVAEAALTAMYDALDSEPPSEGSVDRKQQIEIFSQVLRDRGVKDAAIAEKAGEMMGKANLETPHFANPRLSSFPGSFGLLVGRAKKQAAKPARYARTAALAAESQAAFEERMAARDPPAKDDAIGAAIKDQLRPHMTRVTFDTWVKPTAFTCDDGALVVTAVNEYTRDWLESHTGKLIERVLPSFTDGPQEVRFEVQP